jgi:hypothetical protein
MVASQIAKLDLIKRNKTIYDRAEDLVLSFNELVDREDYDFVLKKNILLIKRKIYKKRCEINFRGK